MKVNNKTYNVYPDLRSLIFKPWNFTQRKGFEKLSKLDTTLSVARQVVLAEYYEEFFKALKKEAGSDKGSLTKAQLDKAFKQSLSAYKDKSGKVNYADALEAFEEIKADLAKLQKKRDDVLAQAKGKAKRALTLGFLGLFGQWAGFTVCIYGLYDWNEMEPWTWIV